MRAAAAMNSTVLNTKPCCRTIRWMPGTSSGRPPTAFSSALLMTNSFRAHY